MELVYLWVEDYKNIHKQGFNFSPRFHCDYNEEQNELTIKENDDYIENFFGKNINVTAIVGKNGSGKSSIFEVITTFSYQEFLDEKTFLVFFNGKLFSFKQSYTNEKLNFNIINKTEHENDNYNKERTIDSLYFGNDLSTIFNNLTMKGVEKYHGDINAFKDETFDLENEKYKNNQKLKKFEIFNKRFQYILAKDKEILKQIDSILIFDNYRRELHFYEMISAIAGNKPLMELVGDENLNRNTIFENTENDDNVLLYKLLIIFRLYQFEFYEARKELSQKSFKKAEIQSQKIIKEIIKDFNKKDFTDEIFFQINERINKYDKKNELYSKKNINDILDNYKYEGNNIWIEKKLTPISMEFNIENSLLQLLKTENIVRIEFINSLDDSYNYFMLSSGERSYIEIFVTYIYHLINFQNQKQNHNRKFLFLFDEIDLGLHPNWQKRLIRDIIAFVNRYFNYPIQLILTSHSPFLLSDIPKQNIIFLDTYKKEDEEVKNGKQRIGNCKVLTHEKVLEKKQTFGANIHTLLSDSFFMENGLMGEFAKSKIRTIKVAHRYILHRHKRKTLFTQSSKRCRRLLIKQLAKFWKIQEIIGEPFLQKIVKNQLEEMELILLGKKEAIDNEIARLRALKASLR